MASQIYGPLISVSDAEPHRALLADVFGMEGAGAGTLAPEQTAELLGPAVATELIVMRTPGVQAGAVLCRFDADGSATAPLRDERTRIHRDAFRVVDFYAPDFDAAVQHARGAGFPMQTSEASYELAEGSFREAHHGGPDGVVTALLSGPADFFADFAEVRDRVVSEPVSISLPLSDAEPTIAWYDDVLGWGVVYAYDFVDASFSELMQVDHELRVRSSTVGPSRRQTYVNIVDYGLTADQGGSLHGQAVAPRRGLLGLVVITDDLDDVMGRAGGSAGPAVTIELAPFGRCRTSVLMPPCATPHLVVEAH
jgi:catechol 2,3-dioxygenase-like lactoylglutathione lyase family enzyme